MDEAEYDPQGRGAFDLTRHCLVKGVQAGAVVGTAIVAGSAIRRAMTKREAASLQQIARTMAVSQGWGVVFAVGLELAMIYAKGIDKEGFEDRAYRLHYHDSQNRTDRFAGVGYAAGALAGAAAGGISVVPILGLGGVGCTAGILAHVASSSQPVEEQVASAGPSLPASK